MKLKNNIWNTIVIIASTFISIFIPLSLVFENIDNLFYTSINIFATIIFTLDIFVNINKLKSIRNKFGLVDKRGLNHYFRTWFIIDVISAFPVGLFFSGSVFQLLRLLKLVRVQQILNSWKERSVRYINFISISFFGFWIIQFAHWISCGWLTLKGIDLGQDFTTNYVSALYWCVTTLTTVGYGDFVPITNAEKIFTIFVEILGVGLYGYLIGNVANILSKKDPAKNQFIENNEKLSALLHIRNIPKELQQKVREYYLYMWHNRMGYDETDFLNGLPNSLKTEVSLHLKKEVISKITLFKDANADFIKEISMHLKPLVLTPGDYAFKEGDIGYKMYFVVKGTLNVYTKGKTEVSSILKDGDFFGEIAIFENIPRTATIKSTTYCDLYTLDIDAFKFVVSKHKDILSKIEKEAKLRQDRDLI